MSETTPLNEFPLEYLQDMKEVFTIAHAFTRNEEKEKIRRHLVQLIRRAIKDQEFEKEITL